MIGNTITAALVSPQGSIDWLCLPRFESDACFTAILGAREFGYWRIAPKTVCRRVSRRYLPGTLILETRFETDDGKATLIDFLPFTKDEGLAEVVRIVRGDEGLVSLQLELKIRFGYGRVVPWIEDLKSGIRAVAGQDSLRLFTPVATRSRGGITTADFFVGAGITVPFRLAYHPSHRPAPAERSSRDCLLETTARWRNVSQPTLEPSEIRIASRAVPRARRRL